MLVALRDRYYDSKILTRAFPEKRMRVAADEEDDAAGRTMQQMLDAVRMG